MSIYTDLITAVEEGKRFKVDLIDKSLWIDRRQIIKEGEIVHEQDKSKDLIEHWDLEDFGLEIELDVEPWKFVKFLYGRYKHSVPKENSNKRSYFKALSLDELTDNELAYNIDRNLGQAMLEGYILLASLQGWLKWEYGNHWFWQGTDKDLVILRNCIE